MIVYRIRNKATGLYWNADRRVWKSLRSGCYKTYKTIGLATRTARALSKFYSVAVEIDAHTTARATMDPREAQRALWEAESALERAIKLCRENKTVDDSPTDLIAIEAAQRRVHLANAAYLRAVKEAESKY